MPVLYPQPVAGQILVAEEGDDEFAVGIGFAHLFHGKRERLFAVHFLAAFQGYVVKDYVGDRGEVDVADEIEMRRRVEIGIMLLAHRDRRLHRHIPHNAEVVLGIGARNVVRLHRLHLPQFLAGQHLYAKFAQRYLVKGTVAVVADVVVAVKRLLGVVRVKPERSHRVPHFLEHERVDGHLSAEIVDGALPRRAALDLELPVRGKILEPVRYAVRCRVARRERERRRAYDRRYQQNDHRFSHIPSAPAAPRRQTSPLPRGKSTIPHSRPAFKPHPAAPRGK